MPPIIFLSILLNVLSIVIFGLAGWLGWSWYEGQSIVDADGTLRVVRQDWMFWVAAGLIAFSFLGRFIVRPMLARGDTLPTRPVRADGRIIDGIDGARLYVETVGPRAV